MEIYVNISFISNFFVSFLVSEHDFIRCIHVTRFSASTHQVKTSQIRSQIEYIIQTYDNYYCAYFLSKLMKNLLIIAGFNTI